MIPNIKLYWDSLLTFSASINTDTIIILNNPLDTLEIFDNNSVIVCRHLAHSRSLLYSITEHAVFEMLTKGEVLVYDASRKKYIRCIRRKKEKQLHGSRYHFYIPGKKEDFYDTI